MALKKIKSCEVCQELFRGRANAKTCSARCRKRLQRARGVVEALETDIETAEKIAVNVVRSVGNEIRPSYATQEGFIGDTPLSNNYAPFQAKPQANPQSLETPPPPTTFAAPSPQPPVTQMQSPVEELVPVEKQPVTVVHNHYAALEKPFRRHIFEASVVLLVVVIAGAIFSFFNTRSSQANLKAQSDTIKQLASSLNTSNFVQNPTEQSNLNFNVNTVISDGKKLTATGQVAIQNESNSTHAFTVQNSNGKNVLTTDTANGRVGIGQDPTGNAALQVGGDITASGSIVSTGGKISLDSAGLHINNVLVCTSNGCISSTKTPTSPPQTIDVGDVSFLSQNQTVTGSRTFKGSAVFAGAFQVQDTSGNGLINVDAAHSKVGVNTTPSASGADFQVGGDINVSGTYRVGNNQGASLACPAGDIIGSPVVVGGIIIGGACQVNLAGSVPTFQQVYNSSSNPHITLNNASGTLTVQDAASPLGFNLFVVQSNGGGTKYFAVNTNGAQVVGDVDVTGQYKVNGSPLSSSVLADTSNLAKLNATQTFSGVNTFSNSSNSFSGDGSGLTNVNASQLNGQSAGYYTNASNLSTGTLGDGRLSNNVALRSADQTFSGVNTFNNSGNSFTGDGSGLTGLNGSNISSGTVADTRLSGNVALKNGNNTFTGSNTFALSTSPVQIQDAATPLGTDLFAVTNNDGSSKYFAVNSSGATINGYNVCTSQGNCAGVGGDVTSSGGTTNHLAKFSASNAIADSLILDDGTSVTIGGDLAANNITQNGYQVCDTSGNCVGGGGTGSAIGGSGTANKVALFTASGTIGDSILSQSGTTVTANGNVNSTGQYQLNGTQVSSSILSNDGNLAKLDGSQTFTGANLFNNASNVFVGDGSGLTALNGSNIASGTVGDAYLSTNVALLNGNQTFSGANTFGNALNSFTGDGAGLTNVNAAQLNGQAASYYTNASNISSGTLNDSRLSGNVALLNANQTFTGITAVNNTGTSAFSIQNSSGAGNLFVADTTDSKVGINTVPSSSGATLQVGGNISTTTGFIANGNTGSSVTCSSGNVLQNAVITGGIITGGTCVANGAGVSVSLQQAYNSSNPANITLNSTNGGLTIQDNSTPLGSSLFSVSNNGASTKYLDVSASGVIASNLTVNNAATVTGAATLNGSVLAKNTSNSTTAFQIQNSSSANLFTVDTSDSNISLGQLTTGALTAWSAASNSLPQARSSFGYATANGYAYVIGGYNSSFTEQSTVYYAKLNADGSTGAWQTNSNALPQALSRINTIDANGYIYAIGGDIGGSSVSTVYYAKLNADGSTGAWQTNSNALPTTLEQNSPIVVNGYVYLVGGCHNSCTPTTSVYYAKLNADGSTGAWQTNTNSLPGNSSRVSSVTANGYIYAVGGATSQTLYYAKVNSDGSTGAWSTNGSSLPANVSFAGAAIINGYIYTLGGNASTGVYYAKLNSNGSTSSWNTNVNSLPAARNAGGSLVFNSYTYLIGGDNGTTPQSTVYYASVNGITRNAGQASIADQLTVGNGLTVAGNTTLQPTADSTSAFSIQNSTGGSLFNIDSTNSNISIAGLDSGQLGAWQTNANALPGARQESASVTANGYVYEIGGYSGATAQSTVYYAKINADGSTGSWTTNINALPQTLADSTSITANGYVYLMGGYNGSSNISTVYYAKLNTDGSTGSWQTNTNALPQVIRNSTSITANGYVYLMGGYNGSYQSTVYYAKLNADGSTGSWNTNANALPQGIAYTTSVVANGYVYVIGGYGSGVQSTVYYAKLNSNGSTGTWSTNVNALPTGITYSTSVVANGYVYEISGNPTAGTAVYYAKLNADGSTGAWQTNTNILPSARQLATSVIANGFVYLIGGSNSGSSQSTVYYASTSRVQIGANLDLIGVQGGDGTAGGSLTANNITAAGNIQVNGSANFTQGLSVAGTTSLQGGLAVDGGANYNTYGSSPGTGFGIAASYSYTTPYSMATADFNSDGKADVVTTNPSSNMISVFMGNGDGTLGTRADYTTGSNPERVTTADFNGDGKPDIAISNWNSNTISVFMNNGDGTFAPKVDYSSDSGGNPNGITTADFNGDGKPDIAVVNGGDQTVSVFINNGNGTFAPKTSYSVTSAYGAITTADFNGDGKPDIAVTYGSGVEVMINNGYGFNPAVSYTFGSSNGTLAITAADFNGDGKPDIAVTGGNNSYVFVFINNGDGTFAPKTSYSLSQNQISAISAIDFNGDGKLDIEVVDSNSNTVSTLTGNGNGTFGSRADYSIATNARFGGMAIADFNGDGKPDMVVSDTINHDIYVLNNGATTVTTSHSGALSLASPDANTTGIIIQGSSGQTADLLRLQDSIGSELMAVSSAGTLEASSIDSLNSGGLAIGATAYAGISLKQNTSIAANKSFSSNGAAVFADATNSTTAFQIQNSAGMSLLSADTANLGINVTGANLLLNGVVPTNLAAAAGTNSSGSFSGAAGSGYYYKVTAIVNGQETTPSSEASFSSANFSPIAAPSTAATLALTAGSNLGTGVYQYEVTYVTANGETTGGTSASITTTTGNQAVNLTAIPTGPTGTTSRKIYRTTVGGSIYKLLTTIADNTTNTYSDTTADASLGATVPGSNSARTNTNSINLAWAAVPGATSYRIYRGTSAGSESAYQTSSTNGFTDSGSAGTAGTVPILSPFGRLGIGTAAPTASLDVRGTGLFKNSTDSTSAFQIQNAAGSSVMNVDTSNKAIAINGGATYQVVSYNPSTGFSTGASYGANGYSYNEITADLNGDGYPDLIANNGGTKIATFLNNGNGTFAAETDYSTPYNNTSMASADLNGDGKPDLVTVDNSNSRLSVYMNNGSGSLGTATTYSFSNNPGTVAIGDLNGDGHPDLVVGNYNGKSVWVMLNNGDGTFGSASSYSTSNASFSPVIADFNGDGKLDVVIGNFSTGSTAGISVLYGNGNGTLTYSASYGTVFGGGNQHIVSADFNGDGLPDIALVNTINANAYVMLNNGDGTFAAAASYPVACGYSIATADFNGDGKPDLATNCGGTYVSVLINNGNGTFGTKTDYSLGSSSTSSAYMATADINGDSKPDLMVLNVNPSPAKITTLINGASTVTTTYNGALNIGVPSSTTAGLIIQGASSQSADYLHIQNSSGTVLADVTSGGVLQTNNLDTVGTATLNIGTSNASNVNVGFAGSSLTSNSNLYVLGGSTFKDATNSTTAFQVQNSSGLNLLSADTTNMNVNVTGGNLLLNSVTPTNLVISASSNSSGSFSGAAGTTYYYKVTAIVNGQETTPSNEASFTSSSFTPLSAPSTAATLALTAGSNLGTGVYQYELTYVTANGETTGGTSASITTTTGNQAVNLTNIPTGPTGTTGRKIYRTTVGGNTYKLLTTIGDNTTTTYSDTTADGSLGAIINGSNTARTNTNSTYLYWSPVTSATSYRIYRGTAVGAESAYQTSSVNTFTDSGSAGTAGTVQTVSPFGRLGIGTAAPSASLDVRGTALFKNGTDSANAFQIQNAAGSSVVNVDTSNKLLAVNGGATYQTVSYTGGSGFSTHVDYAIGAGNTGVYYGYPIVSADFNGDGKPDLASTLNGSTAQVAFNNGDGTFASAVSYSISYSASSIASADFNGDGKPDLAITSNNGSSGYLNILFNNGDGTFGSATVYGAGTNSRHVVSADFNGDGKPDLAVANAGSNNLTVYINSGSGTFAAGVNYSTGTAPYYLASADFNGDGKPDLAATNNSSNTVSILTNNGDGTFAAKVDYATGSGPTSITSADFNGDGKPDLAIADSNGTTGIVSVLLNNGDGTFAAKSDFGTTGSGTSSEGITAADFNADGIQDLAVTESYGSYGNKVYVAIGNGTGAFGYTGSGSYSTSTYPYSVIASDFNGDGKPDLAVGNNYYTPGYSISVLINGATAVTTTHNGAISIAASSSTTTGLIIQGASGQSDDLLRLQNSSASALMRVTNTGILETNYLDTIQQGLTLTIGNGNATNISLNQNTATASNKSFTANGWAKFQDATNSTTAFQIQNSTGTALLTADTSGMTITVGGALSVSGNVAVGGYLITNGGMYATSLPGSPVNGQEIYYDADPTNGVVWHLRYNSTSSYWEYLGGSSFYSAVETSETAPGTWGDMATVGPSVTVPLAGDYIVSYSAYINDEASTGSASAGVAINGTENASTTSGLGMNTGDVGFGQLASTTRLTLSAGDVAKMVYQASGSSSLEYRHLTLTPVRVH